MGHKWWKGPRRSRGGKGAWSPKESKEPRAPKVLEGPVTEYVSVVLKKLGDDDENEANLKILVSGTMTFGAFTLKARGELGLQANAPLQLFVGTHPRRPDNSDLMSSFRKKDYLYVSYQL